MTSLPSQGTVSRRTAITGLALTAALGAASAQAATGGTLADVPGHQLTKPTGESPLAGVWQWNATEGNPEPATFAIFHTDGSYVEWNPKVGAAIGVWRMTGGATADLLFVFADTDPAPNALGPGTATFTIKIDIDLNKQSLNAVGELKLRDAGGVELQTIPFKRPATRLSFEANPSTGSIPATPTP